MLFKSVLFLTVLWARCTAFYRYNNNNGSRATISGILEYRSALTLDWLAAEDARQNELALAIEKEKLAPAEMLASECVSYEKPATWKIARLMLELLKNLEGDDGLIIPELVQALMRSKLLIETSMMDSEPDLDSLVKTPGVMMGEPHATFPRVLAMVWMSATDPTSTKKNGWCALNKVTKYLSMTRPAHIASHLRSLDPVVSRARFIMEEFIQHITPNIYDQPSFPQPKPELVVPRLREMKIRSVATPESLHSPPALRATPTPQPMLPIAVDNNPPELYNEMLNVADIPTLSALLFLGMFLL